MAQVALFVPSFEGGGAERVMLTLANAFHQRGIETCVITAKTIEGEHAHLLHRDVPIVRLQSGAMWRTIVPLARYLRRNPPIALLSTLGEANIVAVIARRLARCPIRLVIREATTPTTAFRKSASRKKRLASRLIPLCYPLADAIIAVSAGVQQDLTRLIPRAQSKVHVIYNPAITRDLYQLRDASVEHPWFVNKHLPIVLGVGRLTPPKDFPTFLHAFARVRRQMPARLVILGEGELRPQLEQLAAELGIQGDFDLPGFDPNPFRYMARADVFVLSSQYEGLPNVLIQAMACGCPVVSTNCRSGPEEILDGGKYGELVPVGDAEAMAQAILRVLRGERKPVPREWLEKFEEERVVSQYLKLLLNS
ncbi:MAG: glycosyltransferase [Armatimonadetes bacterium]|nr:glycosyltransferase [Armatimonadota bacterium]CUU37471.1 Glycosyltransferase involved in cell wall bisynthesis [Armatimonadetes bacterium DC]